MVFLSFTKYSSQNLLYFDRSLALLRQETFSVGNISYKYKLYLQEDGKYILYLENDSDPTKRFVSEPFSLKPGEQPKGPQEPTRLTALAGRHLGGDGRIAEIHFARPALDLQSGRLTDQ